MDASVRESVGSGTAAGPRSCSKAARADLSSLRVALVHDWLTGMRGGEKCLEVLCQAFPQASLYTLIHRRGSTSQAIEAMSIRTSPLQRVPGVFRHYRHLLPVMPLAARTWKPRNVDLVVSLSHCVAKSVQVPRGVPHVCYCFTPMRYAWQGRDAYLEGWSTRPVRRALARGLLDRLRDWDRATARRVTHFVAISETIRQRIAACYARDSVVIHPPADTEFYTPPSEAPSRARTSTWSSRRSSPTSASIRPSRPVAQLGRRLIVIGAGPERARLEAAAGPTVQFLGWQTDEVIRDHYRRCRALLFPGEEDFGIVPVEALACGAPVIALGRGGAAETVDNTIGRLYDEPSVPSLRAAIETWEAQGHPHDPVLARRRAEAFSLPLFRSRILELLAQVTARELPAPVPPPPHLDLTGEGTAERRRLEL